MKLAERAGGANLPEMRKIYHIMRENFTHTVDFTWLWMLLSMVSCAKGSWHRHC